LGGKKESRNEKGPGSKERRTYACWPKETLGIDEGALGSEKESRREIATAIATRIEQLLVPYRSPWGESKMPKSSTRS
jgi:hypothetical protein